MIASETMVVEGQGWERELFFILFHHSPFWILN